MESESLASVQQSLRKSIQEICIQADMLCADIICGNTFSSALARLSAIEASVKRASDQLMVHPGDLCFEVDPPASVLAND